MEDAADGCCAVLADAEITTRLLRLGNGGRCCGLDGARKTDVTRCQMQRGVEAGSEELPKNPNQTIDARFNVDWEASANQHESPSKQTKSAQEFEDVEEEFLLMVRKAHDKSPQVAAVINLLDTTDSSALHACCGGVSYFAVAERGKRALQSPYYRADTLIDRERRAATICWLAVFSVRLRSNVQSTDSLVQYTLRLRAYWHEVSGYAQVLKEPSLNASVTSQTSTTPPKYSNRSMTTSLPSHTISRSRPICCVDWQTTVW